MKTRYVFPETDIDVFKFVVAHTGCVFSLKTRRKLVHDGRKHVLGGDFNCTVNLTRIGMGENHI